MIFLDTGYLIALFDARDALHTRAMAWSAAINEPLILTDYILLETVNCFSKPAARPKAHAIVDALGRDPNAEIVYVDAKLLAAGVERHRTRSDKAWSLTDCVSFIVMESRGISRALAYDEDFEQAGFEAMLRRDPPDQPR